MPRIVRGEREVAFGVNTKNPTKISSNPFDVIEKRNSREALVNVELVQNNQRLQARLQKLSSAYQLVEQQNFALRDKCLRLQNRIEELTSHIISIKVR